MLLSASISSDSSDFEKLLPTEVALHIFSFLPWKTLLNCRLISHKWRSLADDPSIWKRLCCARDWRWKQPSACLRSDRSAKDQFTDMFQDDTDDEGMGDEEDEMLEHGSFMMLDDSGFASMNMSISQEGLHEADIQEETLPPETSPPDTPKAPSHRILRMCRFRHLQRHSAPAALTSATSSSDVPLSAPDYKLLYWTHMQLQRRMLSGEYRLSVLQTRGTPNSHSNTIYCLQLYTYPETGTQVLFTGSKDRTVREWNLTTGAVQRVISDMHDGSVLSICVHAGYLASAGSDRRVAVWDLCRNRLVKVIRDHEDSVLCVRFDNQRLVSCSKGMQALHGCIVVEFLS